MGKPLLVAYTWVWDYNFNEDILGNEDKEQPSPKLIKRLWRLPFALIILLMGVLPYVFITVFANKYSRLLPHMRIDAAYCGPPIPEIVFNAHPFLETEVLMNLCFQI